MVHTVSVSREGKVRLERVDVEITGKRYLDPPYSLHDLAGS